MRERIGASAAVGVSSTITEDGRIHVLVVDDDQQIRETLRYLLEDAGYCVSEAANGAQALALLQTSRVPLVALLDNLMPHLDGVSMLDTIAQDSPLASCHTYVLMTASPKAIPDKTLRLLDMLSGAVVAKPFDISALLDAIAHAALRLTA